MKMPNFNHSGEHIFQVQIILALTDKLDDVPGRLVALAVQSRLVRVQLHHRLHVTVSHTNLLQVKDIGEEQSYCCFE